MPASATTSLVAFSTAVPVRPTTAKAESFISVRLATARPGRYPSSFTTTRIRRPWTPPSAFTCAAQAWAPRETVPQAAAGPERGAVIPRTTSRSLSPGTVGFEHAPETAKKTARETVDLAFLGMRLPSRAGGRVPRDGLVRADYTGANGGATISGVSRIILSEHHSPPGRGRGGGSG